MKKVLLASVVLALLALLFVSCDSSSRTAATPFTATSQFAFIREAPPASGAAAAKTPQHEVKGVHRLKTYAKFHRGAGLKPWAIDINPGTDSVVLMNNDGTGETIVANQAGWFWAVQLSVDGKKGVFTAETGAESYQQVFVLDMSNLQNPTITQLTSDAEHHFLPQLSFDNKQVVFIKYNPTIDQMQAYVVPSAGGAETVIPTPDTMDINAPTFTADGKSIVFEDDVVDSINKVKLDGTSMTVLDNASGDYLDDLPSISPDGKTITFIQDNAQGYNVYKMDITGQNLTQLTTDGMSWDSMFVKDKIVFLSTRNDVHGYEIYSMNPDGTNVQRLTNNQVDEYFQYYNY